MRTAGGGVNAPFARGSKVATFRHVPARSASLRPLEPVLLVERFAPLHGQLIALLRGLSPEHWDRPTACARWSVRDIAAHLLDDDLRRLSAQRDGQPPAPDVAIESHAALVAFVNRMNGEWVAAARRLSPRIITDLLEVTGPWVVELFRSIDSAAPAHWAVSWAGEERSAHWFDVGRDYTERWLHQQQIRDAVGAPALTGREWLHPVLDLFVRALPNAFRELARAEGTTLRLAITGPAGGDWTLCREAGSWRLYVGAAPAPDATVTLSDDAAWRLFSKGLASDAARARVRIDGDQVLGATVLGALAVLA